MARAGYLTCEDFEAQSVGGGQEMLIIILFVAWIVFSLILSQKDKRKLLDQMKESYPKSEVLSLIYATKRTAAIIFLGYGFALGAMVAGFILRR
jgi:hypothetical protein